MAKQPVSKISGLFSADPGGNGATCSGGLTLECADIGSDYEAQDKGDVRSVRTATTMQGDQQLKGKRRSKAQNWSEKEIDILVNERLALASKSKTGNGPIWKKISDSLPGRTPKACQQRWGTVVKLYKEVDKHGKRLSEWTSEDFHKLAVPPYFGRFPWYDMLNEQRQNWDRSYEGETGIVLMHSMNAPQPSLSPLKLDSDRSKITMGDCGGGSHKSEVPLFSISKPPDDPSLLMIWEWDRDLPSSLMDLPTCEVDLPTPKVDLPTLQVDLPNLQVDWDLNFLKDLEKGNPYEIQIQSKVELLREEVAKIDNIFELPMNYDDGVILALPSHPYQIIVLCCYNAKESSFEFFFNNREDMAQVVGVGLEFAKVILIEGWKVHVKEMIKEDWRSQWWNKVQSSSTMVYKLLSIQLEESSSHGTNGEDVSQRPLLWDLAKFFTLQETIATLDRREKFAQSANTGGASSSNPQASSNQYDRGYDGGDESELSRAFEKWYPHGRKENDKDNEEGHGRRSNQPKDPSDPTNIGVMDANATVSVELLRGGLFDDIVGRNNKVKQKLELMKKTIVPTLEFTFTNRGGVKDIQAIVGPLAFNLKGSDFQGTDQVVWSHHGLEVLFGLLGDYAQSGEVVRHSFKHLDTETRTETIKSSQTTEKKMGIDNALRGEVLGAPHGVGLKGSYERKKRTDGADIQLSETSIERSCELTTSGLKFTIIEDPNERQIGCKYFHPRETILEGLSGIPIHIPHTGRFQARWTPLVDEVGNSPCFVEYTLRASRVLEEIVPKKRKKRDQYFCHMVLGSQQEDSSEAPSTYKQMLVKALLVNHKMSHLNGKLHEVRERVDQGGLSYLSGARSTQPFQWEHYPLLNF